MPRALPEHGRRAGDARDAVRYGYRTIAARRTRGRWHLGKLASTVSGIRVLFDGTPAPIIYVNRLQTSVVVPYVLYGKTSTQVVAEISGVQSTPFTMPVKTSGFRGFSPKTQAAVIKAPF